MTAIHASTLRADSRRQMTMTRRTTPRLDFKEITPADIPEISRLLEMARSRTCDYTIGGIYMWVSFFNYRFCIVDDTLFISGVTENHPDLPAFSLPIGRMPLDKALDMLENYCAVNEIPLRFSAIPADRVGDFAALRRWETEPLADWSDYLYDITSLASLSGKKLSKKRNHVNRFFADNPGARLDPMTPTDAKELVVKLHEWVNPDEAPSATGQQELAMTADVMLNLDRYPFEGAVLRLADGTAAAFTLGEIIGDTLFVHIEKMNHTIAGAGETVNKMFAEMMLARHPQLRYVNREEDCGDEGLRRAKESYHPLALLAKFNLRAL